MAGEVKVLFSETFWMKAYQFLPDPCLHSKKATDRHIIWIQSTKLEATQNLLTFSPMLLFSNLRSVQLMGSTSTVRGLYWSSLLLLSLYLSMLSCPGMPGDFTFLLVTLDKLVRLRERSRSLTIVAYYSFVCVCVCFLAKLSVCLCVCSSMTDGKGE